MSGHAGLCIWKNGHSTTYFEKELAREGSLIGVFALAVENENHAWVGIQQPDGHLELREYDHGQWLVRPLPKTLGPLPSASALWIDRKGALWVGTANHGIYRLSADVDNFTNADGLSSDGVLRFFQDREGVLWVASSKGIDSFRDLPVVSFSMKQGLISDSVSTVLASHRGGVWIGGAEGLGYLEGDKLSAIRKEDGFPGRDITTMFEDHTGRLWIGIDSSLYALEQKHFLPVHRADGTSLGIIFGLTEDTEGDVWALTDAPALVRIENQRVVQETKLQKISSSIASDTQKGVWIGSNNGDLSYYDKDRSQSFPADSTLSTSKIRTLLPESAGQLWVVTQDGLIWWNGKKRTMMTTDNGLPCKELYAGVKDTVGTLWLYSRCGLLSIDASQLIAWQKDPAAHVQTAVLDVYDGVQAGAVPLQPQATRSLDGRLWFANFSIVQTYDPRGHQMNTLAPTVVVERISAGDVAYSPREDLKLPPRSHILEVDYTAPSFVEPQKVRFRYKLEGYDSEWQDSQGRRQAFYTDLGPGNYRFRVIAANNDGVWNETGAFVDFTMARSWYQTAWFRSLCVIALLGLIAGVYQLRLRHLAHQYNMRLEERVNERTRIARELHDTLLQSFQSLLLFLQLGVNQLPEHPEVAKQKLQAAIDQVEQAIAEGREAVQGLRSPKTVSSDLAAALETVGKELVTVCSGKNPPAFGVEVEGTPRELKPMMRDEIFRISGEALRNAFRHANAQNVEVAIRYDMQQLTVLVRDDGKGIAPDTLEAKGRAGHWGLQGMRERASQIGAQLDLWSRPEAGTEIELKIPGAAAYQSRRAWGWFSSKHSSDIHTQA
jgi:signal transduction histidine kinase/streptogramin lyase